MTAQASPPTRRAVYVLCLAGGCLLAGLLLAAPARADQTDPRLDELFPRLAAADSLAEAQWLERRIWALWHKHDDPEVSSAMAEGQAALTDGDRPRALEAFSRAVRLAPNFAEAWNSKATVNYLMGNYRRSLADIERVLALEPHHFGALAGRGLCWDALGRPAKALKAFEASLEIHPFQPGTAQRAKALRKQLDDSAI